MKTALAAGLYIDVKDVILLLEEHPLSQVMTVDDLAPAIHYKPLLDLRVVSHGHATGQAAPQH